MTPPHVAGGRYQRQWVAMNGRLVPRLRQVVAPKDGPVITVRHQMQHMERPHRESLGAMLRKYPVVRWTAWAESGLIYRLWQHEKLGWWARSDPSIHAGSIPSWRPVVTPILLAVADGESLTFTFCDWPGLPADLATHQFWYDAGRIKRLTGNSRSGWPGDPPVAELLNMPKAIESPKVPQMSGVRG